MAYDDDKALGIRNAVNVVDIDLDINDPLIDFSGDVNSYNTPKTTADNAAYNGTIKTYVFSNQQLQYGVTHFPLLVSVSSTPATLRIGEDVALSASASVTFNTVDTNDSFELPAPYNDRRVTGPFWPKMYSRNEFNNRDARLKRGYNPLQLDDDNFQIENYVIKGYSGTNRDGGTKIDLIDRLFFASASKAKAPLASDALLKTAMGSITSPINFTGTNLGDKNRSREIVNGDTGTIIIGEEIMSYTITSYSGGSGSMSLIRGQGGTSADNHDIDQSIQGCLTTLNGGVFGAENITDFDRRLFNDFTDVGLAFIDDAKWDAEKASDLSPYNFTNIITKPVEVRTLLKQTIQSSGAWMYFDTILNEIIIGITARFDLPVATLTEDINILQDSMNATPQPNLQVTRASIIHNKLNFSESNDVKNYANVFNIIDDIQEAPRNTGKVNEPDEIISNWYTGSTTDILIANSVVQLKVNRFAEVPNKFVFNLDSKDVGTLPNGERLWYGSVIEVRTRQLTNPDLTLKSSLAQVISVKPLSIEDTYQITAISYSDNIPTNVDLYITEDQVDLLLTDLLTTTEAREYVVVIGAGVRMTSSAVGIFALRTGTLFAGATLRIINQGFIVGAGGIGGNGAIENPATVAGQGSDGGNAFNLTVDTVLDNLTGLIGSGGGGGGGAGASDSLPIDSNGGGGGGGSGDNDAAGGIGNGVANDGNVGSFNFPGTGGTSSTGGTGGTGGNLGSNGLTGQIGDGILITAEGALGGDAGNAIITNGNSLIITAGNNTDQIKGAII
jgi:hypothetical protein